MKILYDKVYLLDAYPFFISQIYLAEKIPILRWGGRDASVFPFIWKVVVHGKQQGTQWDLVAQKSVIFLVL